jgi:hypothetical protein
MARPRRPVAFDGHAPDDEPIAFGHGDDGPLPPLDDDPGDDVASALNDTRRESLHAYEPSPIGSGHASLGMSYGEDAGQIIGRPASPRIWSNAQLHSVVTQLRVWKKINGVPVLVGVIDKDASEEEFIRTFFEVMPSAGDGQAVFAVRPIDREGREIREEVTLPPISEHHTALKQIRMSRAAAAAAGIQTPHYYPPAPPVMDPALMKLVERAQEAADARMRIMEEEMKLARDAAMRAQEQAATERIDLASRTAMSVEAITERMMKQESDRNARMIEMERDRADKSTAAMSSVFAQMQAMMATSAEREREAFERRLREDEAKREREQREYERKMQQAEREAELKRERERDEFERKARIEKEDAERRERERESERQRQHDARMKEMEISAQRDREHAERMIELARMKEHGESIEGTVEKVGKVLGMVGMKPGDLIEKLLGGNKDNDEDAGAGGTLAALAPLLGEGVKVLGEVIKTGVQARAMANMPPGMMPPGMMPQMGRPPMLPPGYAPQQQMPQLPDYGYAQQQPQMQQAPQGVPMQQPAPMQQQMPQQPPQPAQPPAPVSTLPLGEQKNARIGLRNLVKGLRSTPREGWEDAITMALVSELAIVRYVQEIPVKAALMEVGADLPFADQIIGALRESGKIPSDIRLE